MDNVAVLVVGIRFNDKVSFSGHGLGAHDNGLRSFPGAPGTFTLWTGLSLAVFLHNLHELVFQGFESLVRDGGDDEHGPAELFFEVVEHKLREFAGFGHVGFVEDDHAWPVAEVAQPGVGVKRGFVGGEFRFEGFNVAAGVASGFEGGCVHHVREHGGAFDMP